MEIKFVGGEADHHHIEAYSGVESLSGITRAAVLVAHYAATGNVRFRRPFSSDVRFYLERTEPGSLTFVLSNVARNAERAAQLGRDTTKLLQRVILRATGQAHAAGFGPDDLVVKEGDIDALAEAVEPGLRRAHSWVDAGVKRIEIVDRCEPTVELNLETKEYLETEIEADRLSVQDVSVGALNINSRSGRVYFHDLGRTVPFRAPAAATPRTIPTLSRFLTQYAERTGATVNIQFRRVEYPDSRLKRILIYDCFPIRDLA